jgi:hypothetical protein
MLIGHIVTAAYEKRYCGVSGIRLNDIELTEQKRHIGMAPPTIEEIEVG